MTKCSTPLGGSTPVGEEKGAESEEGKAGLRCGLDKASPGSWRALNLGWPFKVIPGGSGVRAFIYPPSPIYIHRSTAHRTDAGFPWEVGVTFSSFQLLSSQRGWRRGLPAGSLPPAWGNRPFSPEGKSGGCIPASVMCAFSITQPFRSCMCATEICTYVNWRTCPKVFTAALLIIAQAGNK